MPLVIIMKSTKVQTLSAVALHKSTQLGYSLVSCLVLHAVGSVHVHRLNSLPEYVINALVRLGSSLVGRSLTKKACK